MVSDYKYLMQQMFYYIDQPCNSYFPMGFVKTKSDFLVISVETDFREINNDGSCD